MDDIVIWPDSVFDSVQHAIAMAWAATEQLTVVGEAGFNVHLELPQSREHSPDRKRSASRYSAHIAATSKPEPFTSAHEGDTIVLVSMANCL